MRSSPPRTGFTLVELLVVIAIIGVLVALLLPAVQAAREAARRTQCTNNLKQIGIGLHNYHDTHGHFPPAIQFDAGQDFTTSDQLRPNWVILMLPFFEQQSLYDSFDFTKLISDPANRDKRGVKIKALICPSDGNTATPFRGNSSGEGDNWARGNYAANGHRLFAHESGFSSALHRGVMGVNESTRMAEITDGLSSTMMVGEIRAGVSADDRRGCWALGTAGGSALFKHGCGGDANGPNPANDNADDIKGCSTLYSTVGVASLRTQRMTCYEPSNSQQSTVRSRHPAGVNIVLCDGSVHFVSNNVETSGPHGGCDPLRAWDKLISSSDGEVLPDGTFQ